MSDSRTQDALVWLEYALGDLEAARARPGRHALARHVANHAQQAAEKALKAALVLAGVNPPKTHDLNALRRLAPDGWQVGRRKQDLTRLTSYAVESRYPDDIGPVTSIQAATAVRQAIAVVRAVRQDFERLGVDTSGLQPR